MHSIEEGALGPSDMAYEKNLPVEVKCDNTVINYAYDE